MAIYGTSHQKPFSRIASFVITPRMEAPMKYNTRLVYSLIEDYLQAGIIFEVQIFHRELITRLISRN